MAPGPVNGTGRPPMGGVGTSRNTPKRLDDFQDLNHSLHTRSSGDYNLCRDITRQFWMTLETSRSHSIILVLDSLTLGHHRVR
jgi:hypothetical protein